MWKRDLLGRGWRAVGRSVLLITVGFASIVVAQAPSSKQVISGSLQIPKGPAKAGFDVTRLNSENYGAFEPFYVTETQPLGKALEDGKVAAETRLLVTETAAGKLALLMDQMAYHHLAQGRDGGKDWMATF
jgi:hypothetical protein